MPPASVSSQYTRTGQAKHLPARASSRLRFRALFTAIEQLQRTAGSLWYFKSEMQISRSCRHPTAGRAHDETLLYQKWLDDIFDSAALLAHRRSQTIYTDRTAIKF